MSNELNNIICRNTDGVFEGCAIGGDRYPGSTFTDHLIRYHDEPKVQMLVLLGEIGGTEEYEIIKGVRYDLKTHPRVMKISVLTIFDVLSSKMKLLSRYNL